MHLGGGGCRKVSFSSLILLITRKLETFEVTNSEKVVTNDYKRKRPSYNKLWTDLY